jgi:hypothetical protein
MSLHADQAFHFDVNPDPDAASRNDTDPDPQHCQKVQIFSLGIHHYNFIRIPNFREKRSSARDLILFPVLNLAVSKLSINSLHIFESICRIVILKT